MSENATDLRAAIENAYAALPEMLWDGRVATVCPCCVAEENARALATIPRRSLSVEYIREYLGSAHSNSEGTAGAEILHFLPRIFELLAQGEEVCLNGNENALARLDGWEGKSYRDMFEAPEIAAIERFLRAYWRSVLHEPPEMFRRSTGEWLFETERAEETLVMIAGEGDDLAPYLAIWDEETAAITSLHIAALVGATVIRDWHPFALLEEGSLGNPHWERRERGMRQVVDWLLDPRRRDRLCDAWIAAEDDSPPAIALREAYEEIERIISLRPGAL